jgi:hypothetical protein
MTSFSEFITTKIQGATVTAEVEADYEGCQIMAVWVDSLEDPYDAVPYFTDKTVDQFVNPGTGCEENLDDLDDFIYGMAMARMERAVLSAIESDEDLIISEIEQAYIEQGPY